MNTPARRRPARGARANGTTSTASNPSSTVGRLELAQGAHLRCRRHDACLAARELPQLVRPGERAVAIEQPLDQVDLRLGERRVEPDAARRQRMTDGGVDDMAA